MAAGDTPLRRSLSARLALAPLRIARKLVGILPGAVDGYFALRLPQHAAGIAYRVLFSLIPLAIVLVSLFGLVLQDDGLRQDVIDGVVDRLPLSPSGERDVEAAIVKIANPASALGLLSLVVFAWAATGMMAAIRNGIETAMAVERSRPALRGKLVDFVLVAATGALVLLAIGLGLVIQLVERLATQAADWLGVGGGAIDDIARTAAPLALTTIVVVLLYRFVPARKLRFRDAVAGAFVTAVLLFGISALSAFVFDRTARLSFVYGSLTAALVFLYSVYLFASALLFGAEIAAAWSRPPGTPGGPILAQLRRAALGLVVHREPPEGQPGSDRSGGRAT